MQEIEKCPVCGCDVKKENLERHVRKVHHKDISEISQKKEEEITKDMNKTKGARVSEKRARVVGKSKNKIYLGIGLGIFILLLIFSIPKYINGNVTASENKTYSDIEKIEVIHFHPTNQCYSCITMGNLAEETINTYFKEELKSGKITFQHLNGELPENRDKLIQYGATGSSLWIGIYTKDGEFFKEENINVWYKINDEQAYMDYLKGIIEQKFSGGAI